MGAGKKSHTASSRGWMPLLRSAEPASTGTILQERVPLRRAATSAAVSMGLHRGVASGRPPSTGMVAPVVGVWWLRKNSTAAATCWAVTLALSRLRDRSSGTKTRSNPFKLLLGSRN